MRGCAAVEHANTQRSCFATVSWPMRFTEGSVKIIGIQTSQGSHFLSVSGSTSNPRSRSGESSKHVIKVNGKVGNALQIKHGEMVSFMEIENQPVTITRANLSCCSEDDWEILETNAELVANRLLDQLRVVYPGQTFPFWVSNSIVINLKIDEISPPVEYGIIAPNTDISIPSLRTSNTFHISDKLSKYQKLRIHPVIIDKSTSLLPTEILLLSNVYHGFTYKSHLTITDSSEKETESRFFMEIGVAETEQSAKVCIKVFLLDPITETNTVKSYLPFVNISSIYVHPELMKANQWPAGTWVWGRVIPESQAPQLLSKTPTTCPSVVNREVQFGIHCSYFKPVLDECTDFIKASLSLSHKNHQHSLTGPEFGCLLVQGAPGSGKTSLANVVAEMVGGPPYFVNCDVVGCAKLRGKKADNLEKELLKTLEILERKQPSLLILDDLDVLTSTPKVEQQNQAEEFMHFRTCETVLETLMKYKENRVTIMCTAVSKDALAPYWHSRPGFHLFQKYVKMTAPSKSARLKIFTMRLNHYLQCSGSAGLSWSGSLDEPSPAPETGTNPENNLIGNYNDRYKSNPTTAPESEKGAICGFTNDKLTEQIGVALGAVHEQNATPQFLVNVAKRWGAYILSHAQNVPAGARHVPSSDASGINNNVNEQMKAFNEILEEEIRFSGNLDELTKHSSTQKVSWSSVGGLTNVKQELKKILEWPIKFPQFFKNAPIRLPCGILFYGYPGTGKSIMGLAIQSIVNVKFIHVKGPELLSKYIGASEQAVQDVFARARESRPCILFFDEFDSLVPRRGHDSSGVTDRVVNQFLSEMDGIDGGLGEGVYLIAATSRPDLIDPAVLRPGRLDRHLFFNLPTEVERREILKAISSQVSLKLEDESEWDEICKLTEGFTGADLNALMVSAQLDAVQKYLSTLNNSSEKLGGQSSFRASSHTAVCSRTTQEKVHVSKESLLSSLSGFKLSVQGKELRKFQAIYETFSLSRSGGAKELSAGGTKIEEVDGSWSMQIGKRATLA